MRGRRALVILRGSEEVTSGDSCVRLGGDARSLGYSTRLLLLDWSAGHGGLPPPELLLFLVQPDDVVCRTEDDINVSQDKQRSQDAGVSFAELEADTSRFAKISHYSMSVIGGSYLKTCRLCLELSAWFLLGLPGGHLSPCLWKNYENTDTRCWKQ